MNTLPLSWCRKNRDYPTYQTVKLPLSGMTWVSTADIPFGYTQEAICQDLADHYPDFVVRGISYDTAHYFSEKGADVVQTGAEAVVSLDRADLAKHSVLELAKRGLRHGSVREVVYSEQNEEKLTQLRCDSSHGKEPTLKYLYRSDFDKNTRCFVLSTTEDRWLGALTISFPDKSHAHTESILRRNDAPVGVMEALFIYVMKTLKAEGYMYFSLGEVPFITGGNQSGFSSGYVNKLFFRSRLVVGHSFDYKGLYSFKNKFAPKWSPVYLAAKPSISYRLMLDLYFQSGFFDLSIFRLFSYVKELTPKHIKIT